MDHISKRDIYDLIAELDRSSNPDNVANNGATDHASPIPPYAANHAAEQHSFQSSDHRTMQTERRPSSFEEWVLQEQHRIVPGHEMSQEDRLDQVSRLRETAMHELNRLKSTAMHEIRDAIISFEQELAQQAQLRSPEAPSRPAILHKQAPVHALDEIQQAKRDILEELYAARESVYKQLQLLKRQKEEAQQENKPINVQTALHKQLNAVLGEHNTATTALHRPSSNGNQQATKKNIDIQLDSLASKADLQKQFDLLSQKIESMDTHKLKSELLAEMRSSDQRFLQILKSNREEFLQHIAAQNTAPPAPVKKRSYKMIWLGSLCIVLFIVSVVLGFMLLTHQELPFTLAF